jgi:hypothetical protein
MNHNIIKKYKTWYDKRLRLLVTYNRYWKKGDWKSLIYVGELQPNQNPFQLSSLGNYVCRMLYRKYRYYYHIEEDGTLTPCTKLGSYKIEKPKPGVNPGQ